MVSLVDAWSRLRDFTPSKWGLIEYFISRRSPSILTELEELAHLEIVSSRIAENGRHLEPLMILDEVFPEIINVYKEFPFKREELDLHLKMFESFVLAYQGDN